MVPLNFMPQISFLILTYNSQNDVVTFFDSLLKKIENQVKNKKYEVIIFDNASKDETVSKIQEYFKDKKDLFSENNETQKSIKLITSSQNLGYAKGINKAADYAKGEILIVINPDSQLLEAYFERAFEEFEKNQKNGDLRF